MSRGPYLIPARCCELRHRSAALRAIKRHGTVPAAAKAFGVGMSTFEAALEYGRLKVDTLARLEAGIAADEERTK